MNNRQQLFIKFFSWLFLFAVFSLVWRPGDATSIVVPKIFEPLIGLIGLGLLLYYWRYGFSQRIKEYWNSIGQRHALLFAALIIFTLVGFLFTMLQGVGWYPYFAYAAVEFIRIIFVIAFFFLSVFLFLENPKLIRSTLLTIAVSPLLFPILYFLGYHALLLDDWRLRGINGDPNYTAAWLVLSLVISLAFALRGEKAWKWGLINIVLLVPLLLWTGSRGGWLAAFLVSALIFLGYVWQNISKQKMIRTLMVVGVLAASILIGFSVLPEKSKFGVSERSLVPLTDSSKSIVYGQDRGKIWKVGIGRLAENPFGFGPAFARWQPLLVADGKASGTHNVWLEIGLTAGWGGLAVAIILFIPLMFRAWRMLFSFQWEAVAIGAGLLGLFAAVFFIDGLTLRWLWLMMALLIAYESYRINHSAGV